VWRAGNPDRLFAANFGVKDSVFERALGGAVMVPDERPA